MENNRVRDFLARAMAPRGQIFGATAPPTVAHELTALLRLHVWQAVDASRLYGRDVSVGLLGVLSLLLWAMLDRLDFGPGAEFQQRMLYQNAVMALPILMSAWVLSRLSRPQVEMRQSLLLVLGFLPVFVAGTWLAMRLPLSGTIALIALVGVAAVRYFATGLRSLTGHRRQPAVVAVLFAALAMAFLSTRYHFSPAFWLEPAPDTAQTAKTHRDNEQLVFEQAARVSAEISTLAPRDPTRSNVFFLGFAGFGHQKVFAEEIGLAAKRIADRFGSAQRTLQLVNDKRDPRKFPLATTPSLRHALHSLSQRMNVDEDILFLALSSHGGKDGTLVVSSELGYWRDLEAKHLAAMLRESGIRWRVIVVSACYSGTFIEPLRDEYTIVFTAASADRKSFGCNDRRALTYFGEAFYRDALPQAASLRAAFEKARAAIIERETGEEITPSYPQAHFGKAIEQRLAEIEKRLSPLETAQAN